MTLARRIIAALVALAVCGGLYLVTIGAADEGGKRYSVELDNAFGLTDGADVKVGGVRAGVITGMKLDRTDMRALVSFELNRGGFDDLRKDVRCETRPQSLIGEYFIDCRPGTDPERLKNGAIIPVEQTETTVPLDLINNIMRRPYRERWSILLSELGAGLAARGDDLNETIRRAVPALRQVDRLLAILRQQRTTIRDLYRDADRVFVRVADKRQDVTRFVEEARDTAAAASQEEDGIAAQWRTFPTFLRELRPTLARLEATADDQIPALQNLNRSAPYLERLFDTLGPFAEVSRPQIRTLGDAAEVGREAVSAAREPVAEQRRGVDDLPEAGQNLAMTLEHLDDPAFAVEKDSRAGRANGGYTGLESLLRYFFAQSQAINLFDANSYLLKASIFLDRPCANYADADDVKNGTAPERCRAWLGPNQPGITTPDPSQTTQASTRAARGGDDGDRRERRAGRDGEQGGARRDGTNGSGTAQDGPRAGGGGTGGGLLPVPDIKGLLDDALPETPAPPQAPQVPVAPENIQPKADESLLDFLLGS